MSSSPLTKYISKLQDARVVIFGGTSGMGFCVAEAAIEHGAHVCICGSKQPKLEKAISRLQTSYPNSASKISGQVCDLSQPDSMEPNIEAILKSASAESKIDHIIYTSGDPLKIIPISEATVESIQKVGNVRFMGPLMLAKVAPKYMTAGPKSSITLTGGTMSHRPNKGWVLIAAYGSGVEGITRGLAVDLAPIRVNMVSPGAIHTELFDDIPKEKLGNVLQAFKDGTLVNEVGTPENVAEAYLYTMGSRSILRKSKSQSLICVFYAMPRELKACAPARLSRNF